MGIDPVASGNLLAPFVPALFVLMLFSWEASACQWMPSPAAVLGGKGEESPLLIIKPRGSQGCNADGADSKMAASQMQEGLIMLRLSLLSGGVS